MKLKVWTNYLKDRGGDGSRERRRQGRALESFRDERERAFRRMVHYQGQYPGCSTTLLTIAPNCYILYLPHSPLSCLSLSAVPLALVVGATPFASFSDNYALRKLPLAISQSQIDKEDGEDVRRRATRRLGSVPRLASSSFRPICPLNNRGRIYRVFGLVLISSSYHPNKPALIISGATRLNSRRSLAPLTSN